MPAAAPAGDSFVNGRRERGREREVRGVGEDVDGEGVGEGIDSLALLGRGVAAAEAGGRGPDKRGTSSVTSSKKARLAATTNIRAFLKGGVGVSAGGGGHTGERGGRTQRIEVVDDVMEVADDVLEVVGEGGSTAARGQSRKDGGGFEGEGGRVMAAGGSRGEEGAVEGEGRDDDGNSAAECERGGAEGASRVGLSVSIGRVDGDDAVLVTHAHARTLARSLTRSHARTRTRTRTHTHAHARTNTRTNTRVHTHAQAGSGEVSEKAGEEVDVDDPQACGGVSVAVAADWAAVLESLGNQKNEEQTMAEDSGPAAPARDGDTRAAGSMVGPKMGMEESIGTFAHRVRRRPCALICS